LIVFVNSLKPDWGLKTARKKVQAFGTYAGLGIQLGGSVLVFFFLGYYLDGYLGTLPLFTILGTFIGAGAAIYSIYKKVFPDDQDKKG
jgi:F0F1-type ATP synthase assembly protein I